MFEVKPTVRDGGTSISTITFCPWCGRKISPPMVAKLRRPEQRPERFALVDDQGKVLVYFGQDQTETEIRDLLIERGYSVDDDGTVSI